MLGDEGQGFGVGQQVGEVGAGPVEGAGEGVAQGGFGEKAEAYQLAAKGFATPALFAQGDVELIGADQAEIEEGLSDGGCGRVHGAGSGACRAFRRVSQCSREKRAGWVLVRSSALR